MVVRMVARVVLVSDWHVEDRVGGKGEGSYANARRSQSGDTPDAIGVAAAGAAAAQVAHQRGRELLWRVRGHSLPRFAGTQCGRTGAADKRGFDGEFHLAAQR